MNEVQQIRRIIDSMQSWLGSQLRGVTTQLDRLEAKNTARRTPGALEAQYLPALLRAQLAETEVALQYNDTERPIVVRGFHLSRAGNLLVLAVKTETDEIRTYRLDRIQGVSACTN